MTKLKTYQEEAVHQIYKFRGRALLAMEQGLGKTIMALCWIRRIPKRRPVVIVTPASIKWTWQAEAAHHFGMRTEVLEGFRKEWMMQLPGEVVIVNYDILASWLPALLAARPQCVIFDECQMAKDLRAQRTKAALKLAACAPSVLGLSGTPITNRPIEFWPILHMIQPELFSNRVKFAWKFCGPKWSPWGWQFTGATNLGKLNRVLRECCMIRKLKKDVLPELPDKVRKAVSFKLSSYKEYHRAEQDFLGWLKAISPMRALRASKSQALTKVGYLLRLCAQLKLQHTAQWIEEFFSLNPGKKLVALTMHTFVIDALRDRFPKSVILDGRVTGRKRHETVRRFQSDPRTNLLLGNWKAAGIGITLHAAHNTAALDLPWTPGDLVQGEDRIHRIGQKKHCVIHYLVALDTIEAKLIKILRRKAEVLDAVLDGGRAAKELDIFETLLDSFR